MVQNTLFPQNVYSHMLNQPHLPSRPSKQPNQTFCSSVPTDQLEAPVNQGPKESAPMVLLAFFFLKTLISFPFSIGLLVS